MFTNKDLIDAMGPVYIQVHRIHPMLARASGHGDAYGRNMYELLRVQMRGFFYDFT